MTAAVRQVVGDLERRIDFSPAHDCIGVQPCKFGSDTCKPGSGGSHGVHGMDMWWYLIGPHGAVQFGVFTQWHLDTVYRRGGQLFEPTPFDIGYHAPEPMYDGQDAMDCHIIDGGRCFYDGSGLQAREPWRLFTEKGPDSLWSYLADYYFRVFRAEVSA